ncbi:carbohydrate ABC transporter permease [Petroclostridium xylanilyticum]|jgi:raffinose/stachyose/melibiose transport system permease protein|uniref:carbohydrate ABC transporter permease n=1 Tax=Petroclostridium xylanilyticum TaxID=1792311 RepID=UPI000B997824|nr:sugar ABC transporter permease [Petroclostridium xylanilyticum]
MKNNSLRKYSIVNEFQYMILLIPAMVVFTVGMIIPTLIGIYYSMTDWDGLAQVKKFIGFSNYINIFKDGRFYASLKFTVLFTIFNTIVQNIFALLFAIALDSSIKAKKFFRTIIFTPALLSPILCGFIWSRLYSEVLPALNDILKTNINFNLFGSPDTVLMGLVITNNWQWIGYWMLIYLAALQSIPKELYEASTVDGARGYHKFLHVTLPLIAPAITVCIIGITTGSLKVYDLILSATGGGPGHTSESIVMYIYKSAFSAQRSAYASALSVILLIGLLLIAVIQLKVLREREVQL